MLDVSSDRDVFAPILVGVVLGFVVLAGCGGDAAVQVASKPKGTMSPAVVVDTPTPVPDTAVEGQVLLPAQAVASRSVFQRMASLLVSAVEAITAGNVQPAGEGVAVRLIRLQADDISGNGTIVGGELLATAQTDTDGKYSFKDTDLPSGVNVNTCRLLLQVDEGGSATRAFVSDGQVDVSFGSEAVVRLVLETIAAGDAELCDFSSSEISNLYTTVGNVDATIQGVTPADVNAAATAVARSDSTVQAALEAAVPVPDTPTVVPSTSKPTSTRTRSATQTQTATVRITRTPTHTQTFTPSGTPTTSAAATIPPSRTPTGTATRTRTNTHTPKLTNTNTPTRTHTNTPTNTFVPTATMAATATATIAATDTPEPTDTNTPEPTHTNTEVPTQAFTPTATMATTATATATVEPTGSTPGATDTPTLEPTNTSTPEPTDTNTPVPTDTNTPVPTDTNTPEPTNTNTLVPATATFTPTPTEVGPIVRRCELDTTDFMPNEEGTPVVIPGDPFSKLKLSTAVNFEILNRPVGAFDIACDEPDASGEGECTCNLVTIDPIGLLGIGDVCIQPAGPCDAGVASWEGGSSADVQFRGDHNIGSCDTQGGCADSCDAFCPTLGAEFVQQDSSCEGFCQGGTNPDAICAMDAECPGGNCPGKEPPSVLHAGVCNCNCIARDVGNIAPAGKLTCQLGLAITVERPQEGVCGNNAPSIILSPLCSTLTTGKADAFSVHTNNGTKATSRIPLKPSQRPCRDCMREVEGAPVTFDRFLADDLAGMTLVGYLNFYDSSLGDILAEQEFICR